MRYISTRDITSQYSAAQAISGAFAQFDLHKAEEVSILGN